LGDELIRHGIIFIRKALEERKLNGSNCNAVVVGISEANVALVEGEQSVVQDDIDHEMMKMQTLRTAEHVPTLLYMIHVKIHKPEVPTLAN